MMKVIKDSLVHYDFYTSTRTIVENLVCDSVYNSIVDSVWDDVNACIPINNSIHNSVCMSIDTSTRRKLYER